ncbi:hypothetical protein [Nocardiopsis sp. CA-288880]|uniref:hypothetical protein n=1 Tax=Nocardiopsis sp. CA-288880 TaxID=3239995 RepID=UPI003D98E7C5
MSDMVQVRLIGGPMDGGTLPVDREAIEDAEPGFDFVPEDSRGAPDDCSRVLYTAEPGGDPTVWHWRSWVP